MKTVRVLAQELGISKSTLEKRMRKEPLFSHLAPFVRTEGRTRYILEEGEALIRREIEGKRKERWEMGEAMAEKEKQIREMIGIIREEISKKDTRIQQLEAELKAEREKNGQLEKMMVESRQPVPQQESGRQEAAERGNSRFAWQRSRE